MKKQYIERSFRPATLAMIDHANDIIAEYQAKGYSLTLHQLYYQCVSRDLLPNKQSEYKRLGSVINDARLAGLIDWDAIENRTRNLKKFATWNSPQEIIDAAAEQVRLDFWEDQGISVEVRIEKDTL